MFLGGAARFIVAACLGVGRFCGDPRLSGGGGFLRVFCGCLCSGLIAARTTTTDEKANTKRDDAKHTWRRWERGAQFDL